MIMSLRPTCLKKGQKEQKKDWKKETERKNKKKNEEREIKNFLDSNENENAIYQNLRDTAKTVLRKN
jgi:hypothetical protein